MGEANSARTEAATTESKKSVTIPELSSYAQQADRQKSWTFGRLIRNNFRYNCMWLFYNSLPIFEYCLPQGLSMSCSKLLLLKPACPQTYPQANSAKRLLLALLMATSSAYNSPLLGDGRSLRSQDPLEHQVQP
jgi:hypothetical protein